MERRIMLELGEDEVREIIKALEAQVAYCHDVDCPYCDTIKTLRSWIRGQARRQASPS